MPPDLLLVTLGNRDKGPDRVELVSPALNSHLKDCGFAETHLHLGAGLDFPLLWNVAIFAISEPNLKPTIFESPGAEYNRGRGMIQWLIRKLDIQVRKTNSKLDVSLEHAK